VLKQFMAIKPKELAVTATLLAAVGGAGFWALKPASSDSTPFKLEQKQITVNVAGEVNKPGLYTLPFGARVQVAIRAAGGYSLKAEPSLVNPAAILEDGEQLRVPSKNAAETSNAGISNSSASNTPTERININTASATQLENLPGVGPKMAAKLIAGRPYSSMNDLDKVKGIGPSMLKKLEPRVKF
jgi:competence protein ComEA